MLWQNYKPSAYAVWVRFGKYVRYVVKSADMFRKCDIAFRRDSYTALVEETDRRDFADRDGRISQVRQANQHVFLTNNLRCCGPCQQPRYP